MKEKSKYVGYILLVPVSLIYSTISWSYVARTVWIWFMPIEITGFIPEFWQMAGMISIIKILTPNFGIFENIKINNLKKDLFNDKFDPILSLLILLIVNPWISLFGAYLVKERFFIW